MSLRVLSIGLDPLLVPSIAEFTNLPNIDAAEEVLLKTEINTVILDARCCVSLDRDIQRILAATCVTTRFILFSVNIATEQDYSGLGIETCPPPIDTQNLLALVHHNSAH